MDSIEVAVRFTEAIMEKSRAARSYKGAELAQVYVEMFAEVLKLVNPVLNPPLAPPVAPPPTASQATSEIFPLSRD